MILANLGAGENAPNEKKTAELPFVEKAAPPVVQRWRRAN
jgi:hypothetical protein